MKRELTLLGVRLEEEPTRDDYSYHGYDRETGVRFLIGKIDFPPGTPFPWYAAAETIPGVNGIVTVLPSKGEYPPAIRLTLPPWRFEGPFRATPEEAVRDFEAAWDASRRADRRVSACNPPRAE